MSETEINKCTKCPLAMTYISRGGDLVVRCLSPYDGTVKCEIALRRD